MTEQAFIRGEGGGVFQVDWPLPSHMQARLTRGDVTRVNEDGSDYAEPEQESDLTSGQPARPLAGATKAEWIGFVVSAYGVNLDKAEGMTKQDLIDMVTQLQGAARDAGTTGNPV